jgi:aminopeptidase N
VQTETGLGLSVRIPVILSLLLALPQLARAQDSVPGAYECSRAKRAAFGLPGGEAPGQPLLRDARAGDTDVLHYKLDLEFRLTNHWIGGSNVITVRSLVDGLSVFRFRLHQILTISDVRVDDVPAVWTRVDEANVDVTLNRAYAAGEEFHLLVSYAGIPAQGAYLSITSAHAFNVSEPWYAYLWWPAKDDLLDKTTAEMAFTVPSGFVVASNGLLRGIDTLDGDRTRYRWETLYQTADYLYCFGVAGYNTFDATWTYGGMSMPLKFFIDPAWDSPSARAGWLKSTSMLTVFSDLYGVYPFQHRKVRNLPVQRCVLRRHGTPDHDRPAGLFREHDCS